MSNEHEKNLTSEDEGTVVSQDGRKVTWHYERKVGLDNYGSEAVSIFVTDYVPEGWSALQVVMDRSESALDVVKAQVWDALGLPFKFTEDGKPVLDKPKPPRPIENPTPQPQQQAQPSQPPPTPAQQQSTAPQPPPVQPSRASGGQSGGDGPTVAQIGVYADFPGFCKDCGAQGIENFYDNRADVDGRIGKRQKIGPDFKCKNCGGGSGKESPLFRPGSYDYNQAIKQASS